MANRDIIVIGTSTGGITALQTIVSAFPADLPASVFVVLHTTEDNSGMLPPLLNKVSKIPAFYAVHDTPILPGRIYIAPPGRHLTIERGRVCLSVGPRENRHRPAVDVLFRSAAKAYGARVIGVVATGYLDDGSAGMAAIKSRGGIAIVQDPDEAVADSMPRSAIETADPDHILSLQDIGPKLVELVMEHRPESKSGFPQQIGVQRTHVSFSCPECGGVLNELAEGDMVRFRCRVGHAYSAESLFEDQSLALERALWAAIRSLEEHAEFAARLAEKSHKNNRPHLADRFGERAKSSREHASVLRELLEHSGEVIQPAPEEASGT